MFSFYSNRKSEVVLKTFIKKFTEHLYSAALVVRSLNPFVDVLYIYLVTYLKNHRVKKLSPISSKTFCSLFGGKITVVEKNKNRIVYEPPYYPETNGCEHTFNSKEIYILELNDVFVHGGTGLIISGNHVLTDVCENDVENRIKYTFGAIRRGNKKNFYLEVAKDEDEVTEAINLCGLAAFNYYHLTFEILSRLEYVRQYLDDNPDTVVLIDEDAKKYPQFVDLVDMILKGASVRYVSQYRMVHCKKMIYPSMNTWMPLELKNKNDFRISDNLIAQSAVDNIRKCTQELRIQKEKGKKVFISRRKAAFSRIVNEDKVIELFEKAGYLIVCTEKLDYDEQVKLFSSASCIVGASGAALTNLVYCNPKTVFGCIIPKKYEFCIYSSIAYMVGCNCLFFDADVLKQGKEISSDQYLVDLSKCKEYISALDKMIKGSGL